MQVSDETRVFDYSRIEWDGEEITLYTENNHPYKMKNFIPLGPTRSMIMYLETAFKGLAPFSLKVERDRN